MMKFTPEQVMKISKCDVEIASFITLLLEQKALLQKACHEAKQVRYLDQGGVCMLHLAADGAGLR
ncbi:hypothetical protein EBB07_19410 [Paenibacillaceae bacterium]|nr:hypothetical protein EBB07_19410 [Paenibacillaceae bacterium]